MTFTFTDIRRIACGLFFASLSYNILARAGSASVIDPSSVQSTCNSYFSSVPGYQQDCDLAAKCDQARDNVITVCNQNYDGGDLPYGNESVTRDVSDKLKPYIAAFNSDSKFNRSPSSIDNNLASGSHKLAGAAFLNLCSQANYVCYQTCQAAKAKIPDSYKGEGMISAYPLIRDQARKAADDATQICGTIAGTVTAAQ